MSTIRYVVLLFLTIPCMHQAVADAQDAPVVSVVAVDAIFAPFDGTRNPGCVVAISRGGDVVLVRAYGMADLERGVPNRNDTVFEPGSVSKQITAAATILLALDGEISLDDDIRKHIPELPDYGDVVTIRHLIHHTSGLRDWGSVAGIEGWPRGTRVHTHRHMLDIASRQRSLNHSPGEAYSYTNTGYNLQAVLVGRVSGMPFAEFCKQRIFEPLGMDRTEWRDDFTRIVKDRSIAYERRGRGWAMRMPLENVHGNGGLLTTAEDLLKFTRNLETGELGGQQFIEAMHRRGVLNSGESIAYAAGLFHGEYRGLAEVHHAGATAGYRGFLTRFPDQGIAVAVVSNAATANVGDLAHRVAELFLGDAVAEPAAPSLAAVELPRERLDALAGGYRSARTSRPMRFTADDRGLRMGSTLLVPTSETRFESSGGTVLEFDEPEPGQERPTAVMESPAAGSLRLLPVTDFDAGPEAMAEYAGSYRSDEADTTYTVQVVNQRVTLQNRWGEPSTIRPVYRDGFAYGPTTLVFRRDDADRITGFSIHSSRVWDLRFQKLP